MVLRTSGRAMRASEPTFAIVARAPSTLAVREVRTARLTAALRPENDLGFTVHASVGATGSCELGVDAPLIVGEIP
jgi:hypothetical protein